jgi:tRNA threonylcarbamoyladenosine modification (KEOPS) complex  Pcc1 subunit
MKTTKSEVIYTRVTKDEREKLDIISMTTFRSRGDIIRLLIEKEYQRIQDQTPTDQTK